LAARERLSSFSKLEVLESKAALANILRLKGCLIEAEKLYRNAHEGMKRVVGAHWPTTRSTLLALAGVLTELGRFKEAIMLRQEELLISREIGENDNAILDKTKWLAEDLYCNGQLDEAEELLRGLLDGRFNSLVFDQSDGMSIVYSLAEVLSAQKRHAESIPLRQHELAWCREQNGDTDPGTLTSINALAIDLRENGALDEAEALFRELVAARQKVLEPGDFQTGRALGGLAKTLELAGKLEEALTYSQQALEHSLTHEGPDALWTNRERLDLARVLHKLGRNSEATSPLQELQASMARINEPDDDDRRLISEAEELFGLIAGSQLV
jgi:tetratricopeptide (TPR) repeat protein